MIHTASSLLSTKSTDTITAHTSTADVQMECGKKERLLTEAGDFKDIIVTHHQAAQMCFTTWPPCQPFTHHTTASFHYFPEEIPHLTKVKENIHVAFIANSASHEQPALCFPPFVIFFFFSSRARCRSSKTFMIKVAEP